MNAKKRKPKYNNGQLELMYRESPVCPWCGHEDHDAYLEIESKTEVLNCPACNADYIVEVSYTPSYTTTNGEE